MSNPLKQNNLQTHQVVLYDRALHPELFQLKNRRVYNGGQYELETWLMKGSHLLRFQHGKSCACELVVEHERDLPSSGLVTAFLCAGEHEYEYDFASEGVKYIASVQTETLSEHQFQSAIDEYTDFAAANGALTYAWREESGRCLSVIDVQQHSREVHAQTYHLVSPLRLVLRSQTIFELAES